MADSKASAAFGAGAAPEAEAGGGPPSPETQFKKFLYCTHDPAVGGKLLLCNEPGCWEATGLSSRLIEATMLNVGARSLRFSGKPVGTQCMAIPHDAEDFGRCVELLDAHPDWRPQLDKMKRQGFVWSRLVSCWPELEARYRAGDPSLSYEIKTMSPLLNRLLTIDSLGAGYEACDSFVVASLLPPPEEQHSKYHVMESAVLPRHTRVTCWENPNGDNLPPSYDPYASKGRVPGWKNDAPTTAALEQMKKEVTRTQAAGMTLHGCPCFRLAGPERADDKLHWLSYWNDAASADEVALVMMPEGHAPPKHPAAGDAAAGDAAADAAAADSADGDGPRFITCVPVEVNVVYEDGLNNA